MTLNKMSFLASLLCLCLLAASGTTATGHAKTKLKSKVPLKLWYKQPARGWNEALPVGNGRISAMVYGETIKEKIQINEESLWGGHRFNADNPGSLKALPEVRKLLFAGKYHEAEALVASHMIGIPPEIRSYQTFMDLNLKQLAEGKRDDYRRELDLRTGIATTRYTINGMEYEQEVFASVTDDILVVRLSSANKAPVSVALSLARSQDAQSKIIAKDMILLQGQIMDEDDPAAGPAAAGMKFAGLMQVVTDGGKVSGVGDEIQINNARSITLYITAATNFNYTNMDLDERIDVVEDCLTALKNLKIRSYEELRANHEKDHSAIMNRVELNLTGLKKDTIPTDVRLNSSRSGNVDLHVSELYFQYGRYLLLGSSGGTAKLPANLQGKWNQEIKAPWDSDYHNNINLQMNYWHAEVANLSETVVPLIDIIEKWSVSGQESAMGMYGAKGWVMHHCTDIFGKAGARDGVWGVSPLSGHWLTLHLWEHYNFSMDKTFLRERAWPVMKGAAEFLLDYLTEGPDGKLVIAPSVSPENRYINPANGQPLYITYSPAMDIQIIQEFVDKCVKTTEILDSDHDLAERLKAAATRLHPIQVDKEGRIMEWVKPFEEAEKGHRHMSHLFGLYPGNTINHATPALLAAAEKSIDSRLENGGGNNGWSRAWIINFYARLLNGNKAWHQLEELLLKSTQINLFDKYDSVVPFQIDGNFGATAGIAELLLQSQNDTITLLPALPDILKNGTVRGLKARGNFVLDITWREGNLVEVTIYSPVGGTFRVAYKDLSAEFVIKKNQKIRLSEKLVKKG